MLLIENLRFHAAETIIDQARKNPDGQLTEEQEFLRAEFGKALASLGRWSVIAEADRINS